MKSFIQLQKIKELLKNKKIKLLLVFLNSYIYCASFPPLNVPYLGIGAILIFTILFASAENIKELIILTLACAFGVGILGAYWVMFAADYTFNSKIISILTLFGTAILYGGSLFFATSYMIYKAPKKNLWFILYATIAWSFQDTSKYYFFSGIPYFKAAYIWDFSHNIIQIASIIGVYGLSILTYALIFSLISPFLTKKLWLKISIPLLFITLFIGFYFYGAYRINMINSIPIEKEISIRITQSNISQSEKMDISTFHFYSAKVLAQAIEGNYPLPEIIITPEASFILDSNPQAQSLKNLANKIPYGSNLVAGAIRFDDDKIYNSIYVINRNNTLEDYYDKIRLVAFGEKTPLSDYFPNLVNLIGMPSFSEGEKEKILTVNNHKFLPLICFEGLFPVAKMGSDQIDFIVNISNEAWFDDSIELEQNWTAFRFRSIESGVPSVKVSNDGISGIYNLLGTEELKIMQLTRINTDWILKVKKAQTLISSYDFRILIYFITLTYSILLLKLFFVKKHHKPQG